MLTVGSLFSGAGLLDKGLHDAGIEHAWFVEREPDRRDRLADRWPGRPVHDDVRTVGAHSLERVDGIVGGFPCKGVSGAGLGTGLAHPETALWAEFARIVGELEPRYVLVENVARILTLHGGDVLRVVVGDLAALGFDVAWDCVRAADVGAPHTRDRWFAVARHPARCPGRANGEGLSRGRERGISRPPSGRGARRLGGADGSDSATADSARDGEGRTEPPAGPDRERARTGDHVATDARGGGQRPNERHVRARQSDTEGGATANPDDSRQPEQPECHGQRRQGLDGQLGRDAERCGVPMEWGRYEPAVRRWEAIHGAAPAPLTRLRGLDDGDTDVPRVRARMDRQRLSALGDGVHVYVGRLLGDALMELARADLEERAA